MKLLVTGCSGLIGSEVCTFFAKQGHFIHGVDNNERYSLARWRYLVATSRTSKFPKQFFTLWNRYTRPQKILDLIKNLKPDAIVHTAAQPSHDKAAAIPYDDFDVNAVGTLIY